MFTSDHYELIDFGAGRRLERFAGWTLDRPCPTAEKSQPMLPESWKSVDAYFERTEEKPDGDGWTLYSHMPEQWTIDYGPFQMELQRSPFGHLGVFPEQTSNWDWIAEQVAAASGPLKILNLFAYTGGSTLAAAAAGVSANFEVEVVHVDSAANTVARGKRNAEFSGLATAPIRWITEDATKFVRRELKRGNGYDAIILDPPSYGHGRRGEVWRATKHLPQLLRMCAELTADRRHFLLLTCHTPGLNEKRLSTMLRNAIDDRSAKITAGPLKIEACSGQTLSSGVFVRLF
ncbi:MAG: class I SAM-dependent methyltransferase [Planctomycetia bacterium]|jgi:23S rRNA (cytosine1962-C5)-methyltransferase